MQTLKRSNKSFSSKADAIVNKWKNLIVNSQPTTSNKVPQKPVQPVKKNEQSVKKVPIAIKKIPTPPAAAPTPVSSSTIKKRPSPASSSTNNNNVAEKKQKLSLNDYINKRNETSMISKTKNEDNSNDIENDDDEEEEDEEDFDQIFGEEEEENDECFDKNSDKIKKKLIEKQKPSSFWSKNNDDDDEDEVSSSIVVKRPRAAAPLKEGIQEKTKEENNKNKIIEPPKPLAPLPSVLGISIHDQSLKPSSTTQPSFSNSSLVSVNKSSKLKVSDDISKYLNSKPSKRFVFSGARKGGESNCVPKLYDLCIKSLTDSIDWLPQRIYYFNLSKLEDENGLPVAFDLVKPIIERASWKQLESVENYSPVRFPTTHSFNLKMIIYKMTRATRTMKRGVRYFL